MQELVNPQGTSTVSIAKGQKPPMALNIGGFSLIQPQPRIHWEWFAFSWGRSKWGQGVGTTVDEYCTELKKSRCSAAFED
jgi:hypothetical protein